MAVLADRGYENTRFADVSAASGVAISTLQSYFGSREDMLIEAMRRFTDREVEAQESFVTTVADPWERLVALIDRSLGNSESTQRTLIEFWRSGIRDEEIRAYGVESLTRYREPFLRTVVEGCEAGVFTPGHDPEDVVDVLLASLAGVMIPQVLHHPHPPLDTFRVIVLSQLRLALGAH